MVRFLIFTLLIYLLYRVFRGLIELSLKAGRGQDAEKIDEMVRDPFCRTYIPLRDAKRKFIGGQEYYFCSKECCDKFEKKIKTGEGV